MPCQCVANTIFYYKRNSWIPVQFINNYKYHFSDYFFLTIQAGFSFWSCSLFSLIVLFEEDNFYVMVENMETLDSWLLVLVMLLNKLKGFRSPKSRYLSFTISHLLRSKGVN